MSIASLSPSSWQQMSPAEREQAYSPSSCIGGNYYRFVAAYQTQSSHARERCLDLGATWVHHRYGDPAAQQLVLCVPHQHADAEKIKPGLLVFIHGGYWQELSAEDSLFPATSCVERGQAFAAIDYTLAPAASVAEIVAECRQALTWLFSHAQELGLDATRIVVAGSSAGAHLAAMVAMPGALPDGQGGAFAVRAAVLVSGIYELEPLIGTSINAALALTATSAQQASPALMALDGFPESVVCWGAIETDEFKRHSREFAGALRGAGAPCDCFEIPGRNHFDVIMHLTDASTRLGAVTLSLLNGS